MKRIPVDTCVYGVYPAFQPNPFLTIDLQRCCEYLFYFICLFAFPDFKVNIPRDKDIRNAVHLIPRSNQHTLLPASLHLPEGFPTLSTLLLVICPHDEIFMDLLSRTM